MNRETKTGKMKGWKDERMKKNERNKGEGSKIEMTERQNKG
jgi:hypothetical protein